MPLPARILWKTDRFTARLQADAENIKNRFNLPDFAGLFSGLAIEPLRAVMPSVD
jgi:hypothetical protein